MENKEIKKETLLALWHKACKEQNDKTKFEISGSDDNVFYILKAKENDDIMFTVSAILQGPIDSPNYNYSGNIVFGEFVEYARFELDKSEFESLVSAFMTEKSKAEKTEVNRIVENTEGKLFDMIKSCEV